MIHTSEDRPGGGNRRKYLKASMTVADFGPGGSILMSSIKIKVENVDVSVEGFENVQDADGNDFFKVEFE